MSNKSREKELARAAAKREEEKRSARRKRSLMTGSLLVVAVLIGATIGYAMLSGGDDTPAAAPSSDVSPASPEPDPAEGPCDFTPPTEQEAKTPYSKQPAMSLDPDGSYTATIDTSCGKMKVKLLAEQAPVTVNSFVFLADEGWYDGTVFHRISNSIDIIQGGDPTCTKPEQTCGSGDPGYEFVDELTGQEKYSTGTVAMANSGPDTNGSQFFIVTGTAAEALPPNYTIFGELVGENSLQVAQRIQSLPLQLRPGAPTGSEEDQPVDKIWIRGVKITESKA